MIYWGSSAWWAGRPEYKNSRPQAGELGETNVSPIEKRKEVKVENYA